MNIINTITNTMNRTLKSFDNIFYNLDLSVIKVYMNQKQALKPTLIIGLNS